MNVAPAKKPMKLQPPIIPVIDVVFNLIIFFMLTPSVSGSDGFLTTNLPTDPGPNNKAPGPRIDLAIRIHLDDVGPQGEFVPGQPNEFCSIRLENRPLGGDFSALGVLLKEKRDRGLDLPVVIHPTTACRHKWVVEAFDTIAAAGFKKIEFAVPYDN